MNEITLKIQDLNCGNTELSDLNDKTVQSIAGSGPLAGLGAAFGTTLGIGIYGLATNQSTESILTQQAAFGIPAFIGGFLTPGP
jgi:hypothetical protein